MATPLRAHFFLPALALLSLGAQSQPAVRGSMPPPGAIPAHHSIQPDSLAVAYSQELWPKVNGVATVLYIIDPASDPNASAKIQAALGIFNSDFPGVIQWVPWTSSAGPNYVDINLSADDTSGVCEANEGYEAIPAQPMTGSTDCTVGTILHEMGHVIGLWHEQVRSDRNTYVTVNYANVIKSAWSNFEISTADQQILAAYDYASVMQYIPFAFTRNGGVVIESIPAGIPMAGYEGVPAAAGPAGTPALPTFDYSAGDKETIRRLYGAAPTQITVTSNPVGLALVVDGATVTTPATYAWPLYSTHTLDVPAEVQSLSGAVLNSNPSVAATFYYTYGRWSDGAAQSHQITVVPGNGSITFPVTSPQVATYSANFIQLVPYQSAIYPPRSGSVTVHPQPTAHGAASGKYFVARQEATLTATAASGWNFYEFNNAPFWLPGGLGANPKEFYVPDSGNPVDVTAEFSNKPVYTIDIQPETFSSNLYVYVDSEFSYTPKNFSAYYDSTWAPGSTHTLNLDSPEYPYSSNSRYNFASWSDGGAQSHEIASLPAAATAYVATVIPAFQPATNFNYPPCGGTGAISPASPTNDGFYPSGTVLSFTATPEAGWSFAGWTYDITGTANPATLQATDESLVFANFNTVDTPLTLTSMKPSTAVAGGAGFTLTLTGTGFTPASLTYVNGQFRAPTFANEQTLTIPITAADIAASGAFQIAVENFPTGWNGCAVFGYQTFLVTGAGPPAPPPVFSPAGGTYRTAQTVTITDALASAVIHYTTNGRAPTATSPKYTAPIDISTTETLKAIAVAKGYENSTVTSASYKIK